MPQVSRRDFLKVSAGSFLALALPPASRAAAPGRAAPVIYRGSDRLPRISLTYDDCLLVTRLHMLQTILLEHPRARVTLFPTGEALLNNEIKDAGIWKWFSSRGHEFAYHSWDHTDPW